MTEEAEMRAEESGGERRRADEAPKGEELDELMKPRRVRSWMNEAPQGEELDA